MRSFFVDNGSVKIHVLENGVPSDKIPSLLVIGGIWEPAERAMPILSALNSHTVSLSLRGRGLSSTPEKGYDLADHLSDIEAVVNHMNIRNYCVLGFSRGASYALGWSLLHQQDMSGLILVDQPPVHVKPGDGSVEYWSNLVYMGVPIMNFMRREALEGLKNEAQEIDFSSSLKQLRIPVVFFRGTNKEARIASDITDKIVESYKKAIPRFWVVEFPKSGHMIPDEEQDRYVLEVAGFVWRMKPKEW